MDGIYIDVGPHRVAHSLPNGGFSRDDEAVRAHVRSDCPKPPSPLVPRVKGGVDNDMLRHNIACARAWGIPEPRIVRELKACPAPGPKVDPCAFEGVIAGCVNVPLLSTWASVEPQVRLDKVRLATMPFG
jgi:hypothetical protein